MWIIPKSIVSRYALDMKGLDWDSEELSQICALSFIQRSKNMHARYWFNVWKKGRSTLPLFGLILKPCHANNFLAKWTSSLEDFPVNHFLVPADKKEQKTQDTFGHILKKQSQSVGHNKSFWKTSKGSFLQKPCFIVRSSMNIAKKLNADWESRGGLLSDINSQSYVEYPFSSMSNGDWKDWVIELRAEYSRRLSVALLTNGNGYSSLHTSSNQNHGEICPTVQTNMGVSNTLGEKIRFQLPKAVQMKWPTPNCAAAIQGENQPDGKKDQTLVGAVRNQNWGTPRVTTNGGHPSPQCTGNGSRLEDQVVMFPTPIARDYKAPGKKEKYKERMKHHAASLVEFVTNGLPDRDNHNTIGRSQESWSTPEARNNKGYHNQKDGSKILKLGSQAGKGLLNPNWVEQLMGLPAGWTQIETELIDSDYSETA